MLLSAAVAVCSRPDNQFRSILPSRFRRRQPSVAGHVLPLLVAWRKWSFRGVLVNPFCRADFAAQRRDAGDAPSAGPRFLTRRSIGCGFRACGSLQGSRLCISPPAVVWSLSWLPFNWKLREPNVAARSRWLVPLSPLLTGLPVQTARLAVAKHLGTLEEFQQFAEAVSVKIPI
jgi:hypothetical protein